MATIEEALALAVEHHRAGNVGYAEKVYRRVLEADPDNADACCYLGTACMDTGRLEEAVAHYRRTLALRPEHAAAYSDLGVTLARLRRPEEAAAAFRQAIQLQPEHAAAHSNLGTVLVQLGRVDEAVACHRQAIQLKPDYAGAYNNLGMALARQERFDEAAASYRQALALQPDYLDARKNLEALPRLQAPESAGAPPAPPVPSARFPEALALNRQGIELANQGRHDEAAAYFEQALQIEPHYPEAHSNLGNILYFQGRYDQAVASYRQALRFKPDHPGAHYNLGTVLVEQGKRQEALAYREQGVRLDPQSAEAHWVLAKLLLVTGDYERGWREFEWRLAHPGLGLGRDLRQPRWDGADLAGRTLLLHAEGGFGDTLHFVRYVPLAAGRGGPVILECQPELAALLHSVQGPAQVVARGETLPAFDLQTPLQSLPLAFGTTAATIPADVPYVSTDPKRVAAWRARPEIRAGTFKIGLVWSGNPKSLRRNNPNCGLECFAPLAELPGVTFYSLQKGPAADQLAQAPPGMRLFDFGPELTRFADSAALVMNLDLIVSVDTSIVHLAGALGKPVWTVLQFVHDFRWLVGPDDSPWYPTMRLFRQPNVDDWGSVFQQVTQELRRLLEARQDAPSPGGGAASTPAPAACGAQSAEAVALNRKGIALANEGRHDEAAAHFEQALRLEPNFPQAHSNLGNIFSFQKKYEQAIASYQQALRCNPDHAGAYHNLGLALLAQDRWSEAEATYRRLLDLEPGNANARSNLGAALARQNRMTEALASYEQALQVDPGLAPAHYQRGLLLLLQGNFEEGWREHEWHQRTFDRPSFLCQPLWDGAALAGRTILLYCEGGLGDYLFLVRYAPRVKQCGGTVLLHGREGLLELLASFRGLDRVLDPRSPAPPFDVQMSLYSLPTLFETRLATIPADVPYLYADPIRWRGWRRELGPAVGRGEPESPSPLYSGERGWGEGLEPSHEPSPSPPTPLPRVRGRGELKVGVVWRGGQHVSGDRTRSVPLERLAPLALEGIQLFSLQKGPAVAQLPSVGFPIADLGSRLETFADTAAAMQTLDVVISVDTSVAHAAGALGIPVWLALPLVPDWRWLLGREDSPWYPSMRLFRQQCLDRWDEVIEKMAEELRQLASVHPY